MGGKVSVIIPCYNQAHFLTAAVDSVLAQAYTDWECIIVNDGSTDNTESVALAYAEKDRRIKYTRKENGGLSSARNTGLNIAAGKFIQFLDADDVLEPQKFSMQLQSLTVNQQITRILVYCNYVFGTQENIFEKVKREIPVHFTSNNYLQELITGWETDLIIPCHCFLFSSDFFIKDGIRFDETLPNHEDFDCWLRIFSKNPAVIFVDEILCRYRLSNHSMSTNMKLMGEGFLQVLNKHLQEKSYSVEILSLLKRKRLDVLQRYKRFDLMTIIEKFASRKILHQYYSKRIVEKLTVK